MRFRPRAFRLIVMVAAAATVALCTPAATASPPTDIWAGDGPWGPPPRFGVAPRLAMAPPTPPLGDPAPPPPGGWSVANPPPSQDTLAWADFDQDGVPNWRDNCLLVPNPDQAPARGAAPIGPADTVALSRQWKAAHPGAAFRDDAQLGQACSGYDGNHMRTTKAYIDLPDSVRWQVFQYLGESGPMPGGSPAPMSADPSPGTGNLAMTLPMCTDWAAELQLADWLSSAARDPNGAASRFGASLAPQQDCGPTLRPVWEALMRYYWAGKRLYTNADGGRITNQFFPALTQQPGFEPVARLINQVPGLRAIRPFPYADRPGGQANAETREGLIFRGPSVIDGRDAILMDWRGPQAFPAQVQIPGVAAALQTDECRAIQTGVYSCWAGMDLIAGQQRFLWKWSAMPWVVKGQPGIDQFLNAVR